MIGASLRTWTVARLIVLGLVLSLGLLVFRDLYTGRRNYDFLVWNVFLALIPYALAVLLRAGVQRRAARWALAVVGVAWLLFLPNAPYIVTDFTHLYKVGGMPVWFDATMIGAFACTGLLLGFASLFIVQLLARRRGAVAGWLLTFVALALSGVGIYLGRIQHLNSWDVVVRPGHFAANVLPALADPVSHLRALSLAAVLGLLLALGYVAAYRLAIRHRPRPFAGGVRLHR